MLYRYKINTINAKQGELRELDPTSPNTAILLFHGAIEAVQEAPDNKADKPDEVKAPKRRGRPKKDA